MDSVELVIKEIQTYRAKGDVEMVKQIKADHGEELRLMIHAARAKAVLRYLRQQELALDKTGPDNGPHLRRRSGKSTGKRWRILTSGMWRRWRTEKICGMIGRNWSY